MNEDYIIKQLSIFSENKAGKLAAIAKIFQDTGVSIQAFNIAEANNFGVLRVIVDKPTIAFEAFSSKNYALKYTDVIAIKIRDIPGGLYEVTKVLGELGINIEYAYAFKKDNYGALIIKVADPLDAVEKILKTNIELFPTKDYHL